MAGTSFTSGSETLAFSVNPSYPGKLELASGMATKKTEGAASYSYRKGAPELLLELEFKDLPASEFDGGYDYATSTQGAATQCLVNWFLNVAPPGTPFTYNDAFGCARTVRFADAGLKFELTSLGRYSGTLRLAQSAGTL